MVVSVALVACNDAHRSESNAVSAPVSSRPPTSVKPSAPSWSLEPIAAHGDVGPQTRVAVTSDGTRLEAGALPGGCDPIKVTELDPDAASHGLLSAVACHGNKVTTFVALRKNEAGALVVSTFRDTGGPDDAPSAIRWQDRTSEATDGGCDDTCKRTIACKVGPFDKVTDCVAACESSEDDARTTATYACLAKAKNCHAMTACARAR
jgi:hypothetical protein